MKPEKLKSLIIDKYFGRDNMQNRLKAIEEFNNEAWFDMMDEFCEFIKDEFAAEIERGNHTIEDDEKIDTVIKDCFYMEIKEAEEKF